MFPTCEVHVCKYLVSLGPCRSNAPHVYGDVAQQGANSMALSLLCLLGGIAGNLPKRTLVSNSSSATGARSRIPSTNFGIGPGVSPTAFFFLP